MTLKFRIYGTAQPKGSMKAFKYRVKRTDTGGPVLDSHGVPVYRTAITNNNPKTTTWQQLVTHAAQQAVQALPAEARTLEAGGVALTVWCYLPRPKKYQHKNRFEYGPAHITKPDVDKLARTVLDALTGIAFRDDAQVTDLVARKRYVKMTTGRCDFAHIDVWVEPVTPMDVAYPTQTAKSRSPTLFPEPPPHDTTRGPAPKPWWCEHCANWHVQGPPCAARAARPESDG